MKYQKNSLSSMLFTIFTVFLFITISLSQSMAQEKLEQHLVAQDYEINNILILKIENSITGATENYIEENIKTKNFDAIILQINTPGGLLLSTKNIIQTLLDTKKPIITWIGPDGSSATSAGAIIASGSHLIYMSEASNIGAATPVLNLSSLDKDSDLRLKIINDTKAHVRSLCELHGRQSKKFEEMVDNAISLTAGEAMKEKIIDGIASDLHEVLEKIEGKNLTLSNQVITLKLANNPDLIFTDFDLGQKIISFISDPNITYILLILAIALIYVEFQAPGGFILGSVGFVLLIIAGLGMHILTINFAGLLLIAAAVILLVLEIYITSMGLLSILSLASLFAGSLILFRSDESSIALSISLITSVIAANAAFLLLILYFIYKNKKYIDEHAAGDLIHSVGIVSEIDSDGHLIYAKVGGERWRIAENSPSFSYLKMGDKIVVLCKNEDLTINVKLFENSDK